MKVGICVQMCVCARVYVYVCIFILTHVLSFSILAFVYILVLVCGNFSLIYARIHICFCSFFLDLDEFYVGTVIRIAVD